MTYVAGGETLGSVQMSFFLGPGLPANGDLLVLRSAPTISTIYSLQGTNISHLKKKRIRIIFKSTFRWDTLVPWRVDDYWMTLYKLGRQI